MERIEPLGREHARHTFDCGDEALHHYLRHVARQHADKGVSRTFVLTDDASPAEIRGYVTLSLCEVATAHLPSQVARRFPPVVPAARLARLAVSASHQKKGYGALLMGFAAARAVEVAERVGIVGLVVDAKDEQARRYYLRFGFLSFPEDVLKLFLPMDTLRKAAMGLE